MESNVTFSQPCRLCSTDLKQGVLIFSEEGRSLYLQAKIRKYLYITVSMEDKLPKSVCTDCYRKVDNIHRFATMAHRNQDKLNKYIIDTANYPNTDQKQIENKGLLHTYLTKGVIDRSDEDMEEMEVKVDPMLFLQCNLEEEQSGDDEENLASILDTDQTPKYRDHESKMEGKFINNIFECSICKKDFYSDIALQNHSWFHIPKNRRVVLNSQNNFYVKTENRHDDNTNENKVTVVDNKVSINNNYDGEAGENGHGMRFACPICGKIISTKGNLKVHLETHRPKGKYGCDICGRIFKTQCNLHRHKEYHTGIQFTCAVCGRVYPTNSTLRAHSITHSDLRPHKCPLCDKTFKRNQDLKFHINQHTGARPYKCPYCPKAFASSGNCFSHRKRMHPLEVERDRDLAAKIMR